jgi:Thioesterase-like superfamily
VSADTTVSPPAPVAGYFRADRDSLRPSADARSSWSGDQLHGRLIVGALARAVDAHAGAGMQCARLTVDLSRPTPLSPVTVASEVVRSGRRAHTVHAEVRSGGDTTARAFALLLRRGEDPPGDVWSTAAWDAPDPGVMAPFAAEGGVRLPWDMRDVAGAGLVSGRRKRVWIRDLRPLVDAETTSPFVRLAMVADAVNPLGNSGTRGLRHVNADLTIQVARDPVGDWLGFEVSARMAAAGVAVSACVLHDRRGPVGLATASALATRAWGRR